MTQAKDHQGADGSGGTVQAATSSASTTAARDAARIGAELIRRDGSTDPFAAAVRATRMPMIITDPRQDDNPVVFVNDAFVRLSGYPREEILGRNCRFLQGPETNPDDVARIRAAVSARQPFHGDIRNHRKDGEPFWNRLLLAPVRDAKGEVAYFFASQVDVTLEREKLANLESANAALAAEVAGRTRELAESEAQLRAVFASVPVGIITAELPSGRITGGNARAEEIIGHPILPMPGVEHYGDWIGFHPDGRRVRGEEWPLYHVIARGRERAELEVLYGLDEGARRWIRMIGAAVRDADGDRVGGLVAVLDVDRERRAEEALRDSEARYRQLFEAMDEGFCVIEFLDGPHGPLSDYIHIAANAAYARHAGIPNVVGQRLRTMVPDEAEGWLARYRPVLLTGESIRFEQELVATGRVLDLSAFRIEPPSRRQVAVLFQDVTERRRAEAALRDLNANLESRVAERTAELREREAQLAQVQKMEAVGHLAGGIAHDVNNMLQGVSSALELMRRRVEAGRTEEAMRYVEAARQSVGRAAALTHRLLAFSRRQALVPTRIDVDTLVSGMAELLRQTVGPAVAINLQKQPGIWPVRGDLSGLENAILNLAINARDAMPRGGQLTIRTAHAGLGPREVAGWEGAEPGDYVRLTVADTGEGMAPDVLAHAFEPFFTTKPQGRGTGLGLSQVYGFVRQSGGLVRIDSEVGHGTAVHLYLPRHLDDGTAAGAATALPPRRADARLAAKVLLVDDEDAVRLLAAEALRDLGCDVIEAETGPRGLDALRKALRDPRMQGVDLLVADVGLPGGLNGRQLADAARELVPQLPVLLITGYAGDVIAGDDLPARMRVLGKPFALDELAASVRAALEDRP